MPYIGSQPSQQAFVTDTYNGTGSTTVFTMSVAPANTSSVLVAISGVLQDPSTYSVSGTTLTFSAAPPSGTGNISCRYLGIPASGVTTTAYRTVTEFTATAGQTTFTPASYTAGYINVYRNGVRLGSADYTATNGTTVVLTTGATAGDLITTESFYVSSVLNAIPNTAASVSSTNLVPLTTLPVSGGNTLTVPAVTGTMMVSGNMPAFSVYASATTTISANTYTKVQLNTKTGANNIAFDTAGYFDNATNYRFTPLIAGYYQINSNVSVGAITVFGTGAQVAIYKNGSTYKSSGLNNNSASTQSGGVSVCDLIYFNGSTDYIELYVYIYGGTGPQIVGGSNYTFMSGVLVRAA